MQIRILLFLLALSGWGAFAWVLKHPTTLPPVIVDREVDKVVTKTVIREVTRPDGTVVKETTSVHAQDRQVVSVRPVKAPLSHWSLGPTVGFTPDRLVPPQPIYGLSLGHRLWESPLWIQASLNSNKEVTLGLSIMW